MQLRSLTRLRLAFLALGTVLLVPFAFLLDAVENRVEAQRRLRHQVVADRIFDELERELTAVLDGESARPSAAYDEATRSETWAPFVLGYFKLSVTGANAATLLGRDQLDPGRVSRLTDVLATFVALREPSPSPNDLPSRDAAPLVAPAEPLPEKNFATRSTPDVLQKLNRSQEARKVNSLPPKDYRAKKRDPLQGY